MQVMHEETSLGQHLTREQFVRLDPGKVYDDIVRGGCCGAPGYIFRREDGVIGVEDANATWLADRDLAAA